MEYTIRWKDMSKHPELETFFQEKIEKLRKFVFVEDFVKAEYVYYQHNKMYELRINISIHKGNPIISEAKSLDPKTATVDCIEKAIEQLRKRKTQLHLTK